MSYSQNPLSRRVAGVIDELHLPPRLVHLVLVNGSFEFASPSTTGFSSVTSPRPNLSESALVID